MAGFRFGEGVRGRVSGGGLVALCVTLPCLALLGMSAIGQEKTETIRAQRFELRDKEGKSIVIIGSENGHTPFIELECGGSQGSGGKVRLEVPAAGGPAVSLSDNNGKERLRMYLGAQLEKLETDPKTRFVGGQIPYVMLLDEAGKPRAMLGSAMDGSGVVEVRDKGGKVVFKVPE